MDQVHKRLLLLAVLLVFWRSAFGVSVGVHIKPPPLLGYLSNGVFVPRAVQSPQSKSSVTGSFSVDEVGSNVFTDRNQKSRSRFSNLNQYAKGSFRGSSETSRTGAVSAALVVPQDEHQSSSLTPLQSQVSSSSSVQNIASQLASGQSLQNQYTSSSQGSSGLQSTGASSQLASLQGEAGSSGLLTSPNIPSHYTPEYNVKLNSSPPLVASQATTDQSLSGLHMSNFLERPGPSTASSGSATASSNYGERPLNYPSTSSQYTHGALAQLVSSASGDSYQASGEKGSLGLHTSSSQSSYSPLSSEYAVPGYSPESLSSNPSSQTLFTAQGNPTPEQVISSKPVTITTKELSSVYSGSPSNSLSSLYSSGSLTPSKLSSLPQRVSSQLTTDQNRMSSAPSRSGMPLATFSRIQPQRGSSSGLSSYKPQTSAQSAPAFPSKYLNVAASSPQPLLGQSESNQDLYRPVSQVFTQAGASSPFLSSQGGSSSYTGFLFQPQPGSSKYTSQTVSRPSASVVSPQGVSGSLLEAFSPVASQGVSGSFSGTKHFLGTSSQIVPSLPSYAKFSSSHPVSSQSTSDSGLYSQLSHSQVSLLPQTGFSSQLKPSQAGSSSYSGSLPQSSSSRLSLGFPKPSSPQAVYRPSASVESSKASSGAFLEASRTVTSQAMSNRFSGTMQSLGTSSQLAPSSPTYTKFTSSHPVSSQSTSNQGLYSQLSSTQMGSLPQAGASSQFLASQGGSSLYSGTRSQPQSSSGKYVSQTASRPPASVVSPQGVSGALLGALNQFTSQGTSGSLQGTYRQPVSGSHTYSKFSSSPPVSSQSRSDSSLHGQLSPTSKFNSQPQRETSKLLSQAVSGFYNSQLLQSQGSLGSYAPVSPTKHENAPLWSQGVVTQSATASSQRGLTDTFRGGSRSESSTLQGSSSFPMPQSTGSQLFPGSPSQYTSTSLSSTQNVASQYSPGSQSLYSVSQKPQGFEPSASSTSQGIQTSGEAVSQGSYQSPSSQMPNRFSSLLATGGSAHQTSAQLPSRVSSNLVSLQGGSGSNGGLSLQSPSTSSQYFHGFPGLAKLGSSSKSTNDHSSTLKAGAGTQFATGQYVSRQGGSRATISSSSQSQKWQRPATSWNQGLQSSGTAALQSSSAQMSSGFPSPVSALSHPVDSVAQSGQMSAAWRGQSSLSVAQRPSILSSVFKAPSGSTVSNRMSDRFSSKAAYSNLTPSSEFGAQQSSMGMFSGSSRP